MERVVIIEELKKIIKPYVNEKDSFESLTEETDFINDLKINSANLVDIILDIEDAFAIVIDDKSMEKILNIFKYLGVSGQGKTTALAGILREDACNVPRRTTSSGFEPLRSTMLSAAARRRVSSAAE